MMNGDDDDDDDDDDINMYSVTSSGFGLLKSLSSIGSCLASTLWGEEGLESTWTWIRSA